MTGINAVCEHKLPLPRTGPVAACLLALIAGLTALNFGAVAVCRSGLATAGVQEVSRRLVLDSELSVPAWFQSTLLFCCALLLAAIAQAGGRNSGYRWHWWGLSIIFILLSMDETACLHEILIVPLRRRLHARGVFYFSWIIPGFAFCCLVAAAYTRFLWKLDVRTRCLMMFSGAVFLSGALGLEMVGGALAQHVVNFQEIEPWRLPLQYQLAAVAEEMLEMAGASLFLCTLLGYRARMKCSVCSGTEGSSVVPGSALKRAVLVDSGDVAQLSP